MQRLSPQCYLAAVYCLLMLPSATGFSSGCNNESLRDDLNVTFVLDRLQHLQAVNVTSLRDGLTSVIHGKVNMFSNRSLTVGALWQAISCSNGSNLPVSPKTVPINPWMLDVYRFTVEVLDGHGVNLSITTGAEAELHIIPDFMVLYSVNVTVAIRTTMSSISQGSWPVWVSADGLWRLGRVMLQVHAQWVGSSFSLSFHENAQILDISAILKSVDDFPVWNTISSIVSKAGLEQMLQLEVKKMNAEVRTKSAGNGFVLFSAMGQATVADFGITVTHFLLVYPASERTTTEQTNTSETVTVTPTNGWESRGVLDATSLTPESSSPSSNLFSPEGDRELQRPAAALLPADGTYKV